MKIKKWISILLAVGIVASCATVCFADISVATTETHVVIDASLGSDLAGENLVVEIFYPNKGVNNIDSVEPENLMEVLGAVYQEQLDAEGNCQVELVPGNVEGWYTARVATETLRPSSMPIKFPFSPANIVIALVDELKDLDPTAEASVERIEGMFTSDSEGELSDSERLGLPALEAYELFSDESICSDAVKQAIYRFMLNRLSAVNAKSDIQALFTNAVYIEMILHTPAEEIPDLLEKNAENYGLSDSKIYNNIYLKEQYIDAAGKQEIAEALLKHFMVDDDTTKAEKEQKEKDKDSFSEIVEGFTFLTALSNRESAGEAGTIIGISEELLTKKGVDLTDYKNLEVPAEVWQELKDNYASMNSFISDFNNEVAIQKAIEEKQSSNSGEPSGSGGSKRSGGSGMKIDANIVTQKEKEPVQFSDLSSAPWAEEGIYYLAEKGIIKGKSEGVFDPDAYMKREEFAKILVLALGLYDDTATTTFLDVSAEDWFYSFVASGEMKGLIKGADGNFGVGEPIRREDVAVLLSRGAEISGKTLETKNEAIDFADAEEIAEYAKEAVAELSGAGIINGLDGQRFAPKNYATRAEIAKMIYVFLKG